MWWGNQRYLIGVLGVIPDDQGRILLARHTYLPPPGWALPGGWLHGGETLEGGVAREVAEELGLVVEVGPLLGWAEQWPPRHLTFVFLCHARGGSFRPSAEIAAIAYFPLAEAVQLLAPELRPAVQALAQRAEPSPARPMLPN